MNKQASLRTPTLILVATAVILVAFGVPTLAQDGIGKKYNSRDLRPCSKTTSKTKTPTIAEAVASVICNSEHEAGIETLFFGRRRESDADRQGNAIQTRRLCKHFRH